MLYCTSEYLSSILNKPSQHLPPLSPNRSGEYARSNTSEPPTQTSQTSTPQNMTQARGFVVNLAKDGRDRDFVVNLAENGRDCDFSVNRVKDDRAYDFVVNLAKDG
jgi:hypothetical protein